MTTKMSVFGHVIAAVALLALLQSKVHAASTGNNDFRETINVVPIEEAARVKRSNYPEGAFSAGETTPVWLAYYKNKVMFYERLAEGIRIVKKAIDHFKSNKFNGVRNQRDVEENVTPSEPGEKFFYPSVLVTMEFQNDWPSDKQAQEKLIFNKILYALAYWNEVNIQLRAIRHPGVYIRIAGIVIARNHDVTPEETKYRAAGLRFDESLYGIMKYWHKLRQENAEFPEDSFNVVATMTDDSAGLWSSNGWSLAHPSCGATAYTNDLVLNSLTGLLVYDDGTFYGVSQTVAEMAHIMGRTYTGLNAYVIAETFTNSDLKSIKEQLLKEASCWKKPQEFYPPGKPVPMILPEDIYPHD